MAKEPASLVRAIAAVEQRARQWTVEVDGERLAAPALVEIASRYGVLRYGWLPGGYDGWSFREPSGGGVIAVPFAIKDAEVWVGLVEEVRPNQGGTVLNVPRGVLDPGEPHANAAARELWEETGLASADVCELPGQPVNANSAYFETPNAGEGARFYALEIPADWLTRDEHGYRVCEDRIDGSAAAVAERQREHIGVLRFLAWHEAAALADMFSVAAVARLLAELRRRGRWPLQP